MKRVVTPANIIILLASLLTTSSLYSQELTSAEHVTKVKEYFQSTPGEDVYLHIDRSRYIAGEDIWFSIYTLDNETGNLSLRSAVAYVELLNPWNVPLIQTRLRLSGGRGTGNFTLPDSISSGTYTIRAYTNWMKNFLPNICYMQDLDVINPFRNSDFTRKVSSMNNQKNKETPVHYEDKGAIALAADSVFGRRELVILKIGTGDSDAGLYNRYDMSISVTPAGVSSESQGIAEYMFSRKKSWEDILNGIKAPLQYSFESSGHYLSVMIKYRGGSMPDSSKFLYMSIQGKVAEFRYASRDTADHFNFILPVDNKFRNLIFQPEHTSNNMILEIEPSFSWKLPSTYCYRDTLNDTQLDMFSELSFNYQASSIYGIRLKKEAVIKDEVNLKKRRFYGIPEMEVFLDDYISLPTMQEVFFELLPGIILRSRKSGYEMQITNPLTGVFYKEPPLVMIDGVMINDMSVLAELNPEIVEKIEVVKTPYLMGDLVLHGIVNVLTRSGNFRNADMPDYAVIFPYRVIEEPSTITTPDYSDELTRLNRIPDLRNTLYWNPSVKTDMNGKAEIKFWTSDLPGNYVIIIHGISATGEKVTLHKSLVVR